MGRILFTNGAVGRGCPEVVGIASAPAWRGFVALRFADAGAVVRPAVGCRKTGKNAYRPGAVGRS